MKLGICRDGVSLVVGNQCDEVFSIIEDKMRGKEVFYIENGGGNEQLVELALEKLLGSVDKDLLDDVVRDFKLIGRKDKRVVNGKDVVFDMAHTVNSIKMLRDFLLAEFPDREFVFLVSMMKGKNIDGVLDMGLGDLLVVSWRICVICLVSAR